jgi:hypothetical protein
VTLACRFAVRSVSVASNAVDRKSMGHTVAEQSWNEADFLCISCI